MERHYIPAKTYEVLTKAPDMTGASLYRKGYATSFRTGRRWKGWFDDGIAIPKEDYEQPVVSKQMADLEIRRAEHQLSLDEILDRAAEEVERKQMLDPVFTIDELDFNTDKPVAFVLLSCAHLGGRYTAYRQFKEIYQRILNIPRLYVGSLGDDIEGFIPQFPSTKSVIEQIWQVDVQVDIITRLLGELSERNKLLFGMGSQHGGKWFNKNYGDNPIKKAYLDAGVPYYDGQAYLKFMVGDQVYQIAVSHEFSGSSMWNPVQAQSRAFRMKFPMADVVAMGDKHDYAAMDMTGSQWEVEAGNRKSDHVVLLQVGTAKTGPDPYSIAGWSKGRFGWPIVVFYPDRHEVVWSLRLDDVEHWLNG